MSNNNANVRSKHWCFTHNNYDELSLEHIRSLLKTDKVRYALFGREVGEQGTPHLQGYVSFNKRQTFKAMQRGFVRCHLSPAKGTEKQNFDYCSKEGDFEEFGERSQQGKRTDLEEAVETLKNGTLASVAEEHPATYIKFYRGLAAWKLAMDTSYEHHDVRGVWIWGPPGTGKSHIAREKYPNIYVKPQNKWWDGYQGQEAILIDDFDKNGACLGHHLKIWADKYATTGETKGGTINLRYKVLIVTSNYTPEQLWPEDTIMCAAIKRRFLMQHKAVRHTTVTFRE